MKLLSSRSKSPGWDFSPTAFTPTGFETWQRSEVPQCNEEEGRAEWREAEGWQSKRLPVKLQGRDNLPEWGRVEKIRCMTVVPAHDDTQSRVRKRTILPNFGAQISVNDCKFYCLIISRLVECSTLLQVTCLNQCIVWYLARRPYLSACSFLGASG